MGVLTLREARRPWARPARLLIALAALAPAFAAGEDSATAVRRPYAIARIGMAVPFGDLDALGFGTGGTLEVGAGFPLVRHVSVEASAGWIAFQDRRSGRVRLGDTLDAPVEDFTTTRNVDLVPLLATLRLSAAAGRIEVHAGGGAGAYLATTGVARTGTVSGEASSSARDTTLGLHAGAGISWSASPAVTLGVDARWVSAKATFRFETVSSTTTTQVHELALRLDGVVVAATLARRF